MKGALRGGSLAYGLRLILILAPLHPSAAEAATWYVNDTSLVGDVYTTAVGSDANSGLAPGSPKRRIQTVLALVAAGDTVLVDAGTYGETVTLTVDSIAFVGAGPARTLIDPGDGSAASQLIGVDAAGLGGLLVRDLGIRNAYLGVRLSNVTGSLLERVEVSAVGGAAITLESSPGNVVRSCTAMHAGDAGVLVDRASNDARVESCTAEENGGVGFWVKASTGAVLRGNRSDSNGREGFQIEMGAHDAVLDGNSATGNAIRGYLVYDAARCVLTRNVARGNLLHGVLVEQASNDARVETCTAEGNGGIGFWVNASTGATLRGNRSDTNGREGFQIDPGSHDAVLDSNTATGNALRGYLVYDAARCVLTRNVARGNLLHGFLLDHGSNDARVETCTAEGNGGIGIWVNASTGATLRGNRSDSNGREGFQIDPGADDAVLDSNTATANALRGYLFYAAARPVLTRNVARGNLLHGFLLDHGSNDAVIVGNGAFLNGVKGIWLYGSSARVLRQNEADGNGSSALEVGGGGTAAGVEKNNLLQAGPECLYAATGGDLDVRRTWWGTTDSVAIFGRLAGPDMLRYIPYRLGPVDTSADADTVAPRAPDTVAATAVDTFTIRVSWSSVTEDEEADDYPTSLAGYRVWRSTSAAGPWVVRATVSAATTSFVDSGLSAGQAGTYRVTAFDDRPIENQSYFSSEAAYGPPDPTGPNIWYLNDDSLTGDSFTTNVGNDANDGLTPATPKRRISALGLSAGDTVLIDSGDFTEPTGIGLHTGPLWVIGVDSSSTVFRDTRTACFSVAIDVFEVNNVTLRDLQVVTYGSNSIGIRLFRNTGSKVEHVRVRGARNSGIEVWGGNNVDVEGCLVEDCFRGINASNATGWSRIHSNVCRDIYGVGILVGNGFRIDIRGNLLEWCDEGLRLDNEAMEITVAQNTFRHSTRFGLNVGFSWGCLFERNRFDENSGWAIHLSPSAIPDVWWKSENVFRKNNVVGGSANPDRGVWNEAPRVFDFTRTWWGTTDASRIPWMMSPFNGVANVPFRLGWIDTAPGADVVAPRAPDTVAAEAIGTTRIRVSWSPVTEDEEADDTPTNLAGYRVWRSTTPAASLWTPRATAGSATTSIVDSGLRGGETWCYRVTALDDWPVENQSFFSAAVAETTTISDSPNCWYVNDAVLAGDTFTTAAGDDDADGLTPATPKRRLTSVMPLLSTGDTVFVDAGVYDETRSVTVGVSRVWVIGADSSSSVIDFGDTSTGESRALKALNLSDVFLRDLGVRRGWCGVVFGRVVASRVERVRAETLGAYGIFLDDSSQEITILSNEVRGAGSYGIHLRRSESNAVIGNVVSLCANVSDGILINGSSFNIVRANVCHHNNNGGLSLSTGSSNNEVSENLSYENANYGIGVGSWCDANRLERNVCRGNGGSGLLVAGSRFNYLARNMLVDNDSWCFQMQSGSSNIFWKNMLEPSVGRPESGVLNSSAAQLDARLNWWGTTDGAAIARMKSGQCAVNLVPFRLGIVDTAADADTVAPRAPDTVAAVGNGPAEILVSWSTVAQDEETDPYPTNLAGYRIYRSTTPAATLWTLRATAGPAATSVVDSGLAAGQVWCYRVTAIDGWPIENQSYFSNQTATATTPIALGANAWYVNDTSLAGDVYTSAVGDDANDGLTPATPKRTIGAVTPHLTEGDTIYVDAGTYAEAVVIDTNGVGIVGKDSASTIIDPPGSWNGYGIYVEGRHGLAVSDLRIADAEVGIYFCGSESSSIQRCALSNLNWAGIVLEDSSNGNTLDGNSISDDWWAGVYIWKSTDNRIIRNTITRVYDGIFIDDACTGTVIDRNTLTMNGWSGVWLIASDSSSITRNVVDSNGWDSGLGIGLDGSNNVLVEENVCRWNDWLGIGSWDGQNNLVRRNLSMGNTFQGIRFEGMRNTATLNEVVDNDTGIRIYGASIDNAVVKNNITASAVYHVHNPTGFEQNFTRNWWGTTDAASIAARFNDAANTFYPFRLGPVDTAPGADTVAPRAPDTVAATMIDTSSIRVAWSAVTQDEEVDAFAVNLAGYRVYRATTPTAFVWTFCAAAGPATTEIVDSGLTEGETCYYRVTAFDDRPIENQSFYSGTIASACPGSPPPGSGANAWYVNDTALAGDSFTTAAGSDANDGLTPATPMRSLAAVMPLLTSGDSVFVDAGTYYETITIGAHGVAVIGVDSIVTIIDGRDSTTAGSPIVYAANISGLLLRDLQVRNGRGGVRWTNVDLSRIERVHALQNGDRHGVYLEAGCESDVITGTFSGLNEGFGIVLFGSGHTVTSSRAEDNRDFNGGFYVYGTGHTLRGNISYDNWADGFLVAAASSCSISANIAWGNGDHGILVFLSSNNEVTDNNFQWNGGYGIEDNECTGDVFRRNVVTNDQLGGIRLVKSSATATLLNCAANLSWIVRLEGTGPGDTMMKSNLTASAANPDSYVLALNASARSNFARNWWGTTDSSVIRSRIGGAGGDSVLFIPYRLGPVDMTPGADTVAPRAPDTVAAAVVDTSSIRVSWSSVTLDEEADDFAVNLAGYRVYRSTTPAAFLWTLRATAGPATTIAVDSGLGAGETWYYRVTAFDDRGIENQSFYSDSIASAATAETAPPDTAAPEILAFGTSPDVLATASAATTVTGRISDAETPATVSIRRIGPLSTSDSALAVAPDGSFAGVFALEVSGESTTTLFVLAAVDGGSNASYETAGITRTETVVTTVESGGVASATAVLADSAGASLSVRQETASTVLLSLPSSAGAADSVELRIDFAPGFTGGMVVVRRPDTAAFGDPSVEVAAAADTANILSKYLVEILVYDSAGLPVGSRTDPYATDTAAGTGIRIVIHYDEADFGGSEPFLRMHYYDEATGTWRPVSDSPALAARDLGLDLAADTIGFQIAHFTIFAPIPVGAPAADLSGFQVAPNPYRPNDGDPATGVPYTGAAGTGIYFLNVPASVRIEVYSIAGRKAAEFSTAASNGQVQWDVRNGRGEDVASGVYLYVVTDAATGERRTGKVVIIR